MSDPSGDAQDPAVSGSLAEVKRPSFARRVAHGILYSLGIRDWRLLPRPVVRKLRDEPSAAGVFVKAWYTRGLYDIQVDPWRTLAVSVDGKSRAVLTEGSHKRSMSWHALGPGHHSIQVAGIPDGSGRSERVILCRESVSIEVGSVFLLSCLPPRGRPWRRSQKPEGKWDLRRLR